MRERDRKGTVLISLLGPMLAVIAVGLVVIYLVQANWESFPDGVKVGVAVVGGILVFALMWGATRDQNKRGF